MVDWLDHRKYHNQVQQVKVKKALERSVERLDKEREEREQRERDWATSKIDRLAKLIEGKKLGGLESKSINPKHKTYR